MPKSKTQFVCQSCRHQESKWLGRCPSCDSWGSLAEEFITKSKGTAPLERTTTRPIPVLEIETLDCPRLATGIPELDQVLGGGLVLGSLILVGGDPGIGKSTLLLQAAGNLANELNKPVLYVTGEESAQQVRLRSERLTTQASQLYIFPETSLEAIEHSLDELNPAVLIIDSIQTIGTSEVASSVGSVSQIREVTNRLMGIAKQRDLPTFVVGHVTKEGAIAGPKLLEHMVDTVLYFEGERTGSYRILRAHKNRFGSAREIGVFEMMSDGLKPVTNPSELFLSQRSDGPGTAVVSSLEGSRPLLLEVQTLVTPAVYGSPRRTTVGVDQQRIAILGAVLEARCGLEMGGLDLYVNVAGGVRIQEPAADLGIIAALSSSITQNAIAPKAIFIGEVGLSGEIRGVTGLEIRLQEAQSLGFNQCYVPAIDLERTSLESEIRAEVIGIRNVNTLMDYLTP
ncbi:MAG: DNA repair protein RadA [Myxococcota bacterium]|nr:DNA repair protein RadA [Myxococcota bacterium]